MKKNYPDSKNDMFAVFIERCGEMIKGNRYQAMITQHAWMFLSGFEKLRRKLQLVDTVNMAHLGARAFEEIGGEVVQTTSFVMRKSHIAEYKGTYCRLIEPTTQKGKEEMYLAGENRFYTSNSTLSKIPGKPIAYSMKHKLIAFFDGECIGDYCTQRMRISTGDNNRFLRFWFEVESVKMFYPNKWVAFSKGGEYRKWYGNWNYLLNYENNGYELKNFLGFSGGSDEWYFKPGLVWTDLSTGKISFRNFPSGAIACSAGPMISMDSDKIRYYMAGYLNSSVANEYVKLLCTTLHFQWGDVAKIPVIYSKTNEIDIVSIVQDNIVQSKQDWDSFETSWDFALHPLIRCASFSMKEMQDDRKRYIKDMNYIEEAYKIWENECFLRFNQLKSNEEELNRIFIDIYDLQDELSPEIEDKDITVRKADLGREIRSFVSYAVGCMFGRYSLDQKGLMFAGGDMKDIYAYYSGTFADVDTADIRLDEKHTVGEQRTPFYYLPVEGKEPLECWKVDADNIIPITDEEYFTDDIVNRFVEFVKVVYGEDTLEENLDFIAHALGNKGDTSREVIRNYFLKDFFTDHLKVYQKRPIYWLFDSGKRNGFKALIYMHRYNADTIGNLRIDYLHRMERIYESEISRMEDMIDNSGKAREVTAASKRKEKLQKQLKECQEYDEKVGHLALSRIEMDLDDGVKVNYEKVQTAKDGKKYQVLAKMS